MVKFQTPQVYTRKDGKFELYIRYTDMSFIGVRKKSTILKKNTAVSRNKAEQILKDRILKSLSQNTIKRISFEDLSKQYLKHLKDKSVHYSTLRGRTSILNILTKEFDSQIVSTITSVQINKVLNSALYDKGLANATVAGYKTALSQLFNYAFKFGYISNNPMSDVSIDYKNESNKRRDKIENYYLSDSEYNSILNYCKRKNRMDYYDLFVWLYYTGMRVGEACALTVQDIIKENDMYYANINGTLIYTKEKGWHKQNVTKTAAGKRKVSLPITLNHIINNALKRKNKPNDYLFYSTYNNKPFNPHSVFFFMNRMEKRIGLRHFGTHIFRHTHISKLAEKGYPLELISKRVGHEDSEITRLIYLHITKKAQLSFDRSLQNVKL